MKVLYVASEVAPFIKTGGLADVAGSLPQALTEEGCEVSVVCPRYSLIGKEWLNKMELVDTMYVQLAWRSQYCGIYHLKKDQINYYFIDNEYYFDRKQIYGEYDDAERFAFFCHAVLDMLPIIGFHPDIINCNDWQTALVPVYFNLYYKFSSLYAKMKTVYTIHNIQYQGQFGDEITDYVLGIDRYQFDNGFLQQDGSVNLMKAAIVCANCVTTVSPSYAQEIQTPFYGFSLDPVLRWYNGKVYGILNGLNIKYYDPETDTHLFENYGIDTLEKKKKNREGLLEMCGLEADDDTMVIGMIGRLVSQKGLDLLQSALGDILSLNVRLIVLGTGDYGYEQMLLDAKKAYPDKLSANIMFNNDLANKIYGGADLLLMPSLFEPCGLTQMIAMRYGTIPLVRETGGLKDTVTAYNQYTGTGDGFSFSAFNAHDMLYVLQEAIHVFTEKKDAWRAMQLEGMKGDYSWTTSAAKYVEVYKTAMAAK